MKKMLSELAHDYDTLEYGLVLCVFLFGFLFAFSNHYIVIVSETSPEKASNIVAVWAGFMWLAVKVVLLVWQWVLESFLDKKQPQPNAYDK